MNDFITPAEGQKYSFALPNAWAYNYKTSGCGCKYQAVRDTLNVEIKPTKCCRNKVHLLTAELDDNTIVWNFLLQCVTGNEDAEFYYGLSKTPPTTDIKLNVSTNYVFNIDTMDKEAFYMWIAVPNKLSMNIKDNLGNTIEGFGLDTNKVIKDIEIDGKDYLLYLYHSDIYINNNYTITING